MNKKKKVIVSKSGHCPKCGSNNLNYDNHEFNGDSVLFNYECKKCKFLGFEEYTCNFIGHSDTYGNEFWEQGEETNND